MCCELPDRDLLAVLLHLSGVALRLLVLRFLSASVQFRERAFAFKRSSFAMARDKIPFR
jgi:hypothetical protein